MNSFGYATNTPFKKSSISSNKKHIDTAGVKDVGTINWNLKHLDFILQQAYIHDKTFQIMKNYRGNNKIYPKLFET